MLKVVAVGGGSIGFGAARPEVTSLSREMIRLSGKRRPSVLFIPTASSDDKAYIRAFQSHFGRTLGCPVDLLLLCGRNPDRKEMRDKVAAADILYVGGGNTLRMMNRWKRLGLDRILQGAAGGRKVLCGTSAGAICWFRQGSSDSRRFRHPGAKLIKVTGLGLIDALACPHYDVEKDRKPQLREMMKRTPGAAVALDNCAALEVAGNRFRVIASKAGANAYRAYWLKGRYYQAKIPKGLWQPLTLLPAKGVGAGPPAPS